MIKRAIVHDWSVGYAGSEKCVESFTNLYPDADIFMLFDFLTDKERKIIFKDKIPSTSFLQTLPFAKNNHRKYLPLFPFAIEQFDLNKYDLILSSSHAIAKGVLTNSNQLHICYCHTPVRYAWDLTHQYLKEAGLTTGIKGFFAKSVLHYLRIWDVAASNRVDYFIANSNYIAKRIKKIYGRDSTVIYPPVDTNKFLCNTVKENFYVTASRFVPYKRIDVIVEAFANMPNKKLVVIGEGPDEKKIKLKAKKNIEFIGFQKGESLANYLQKAKAFVFAAEEDFGILPVEALSCGTPVIALNKGGTKETIRNGINGILFQQQNASSIISAVNEFEQKINSFDLNKISESAKKYDRTVFEQKINEFVNKKCNEFFK